MPTYEYTCAKCECSFEWVQTMSSEPLKTCPKEVCGQKKWGKGKVKRAIGTGAGLIFKGSGFYITDYRSDGYKDAAKKDTAPAAATPSPAPAAESKSTPADKGTTPAKPVEIKSSETKTPAKPAKKAGKKN